MFTKEEGPDDSRAKSATLGVVKTLGAGDYEVRYLKLPHRIDTRDGSAQIKSDGVALSFVNEQGEILPEEIFLNNQKLRELAEKDAWTRYELKDGQVVKDASASKYDVPQLRLEQDSAPKPYRIPLTDV